MHDSNYSCNYDDHHHHHPSVFQFSLPTQPICVVRGPCCCLQTCMCCVWSMVLSADLYVLCVDLHKYTSVKVHGVVCRPIQKRGCLESRAINHAELETRQQAVHSGKRVNQVERAPHYESRNLSSVPLGLTPTLVTPRQRQRRQQFCVSPPPTLPSPPPPHTHKHTHTHLSPPTPPSNSRSSLPAHDYMVMGDAAVVSWG